MFRFRVAFGISSSIGVFSEEPVMEKYSHCNPQLTTNKFHLVYFFLLFFVVLLLLFCFFVVVVFMLFFVLFFCLGVFIYLYTYICRKFDNTSFFSHCYNIIMTFNLLWIFNCRKLCKVSFLNK